MPLKMPKGKYMCTVKVGEKGQIVIPKPARDMFSIQPGDTLLLLADKDRGIGLVDSSSYLDFTSAVFEAQKYENGDAEEK